MDDFNKFIREEYAKYDRFVKVDKDDEFNKHFKKWNFFDYDNTLKVTLKDAGQVFLYEIYDHDDNTISYPKIGIFLNYLPCDQTLEMEWMDKRRTWEDHRKYRWNYKDGSYHNEEKDYNFYYLGSEHSIKTMPQWSDYHLIYGVWDRLPDWKTLKRHYENTWWFHRPIEEKRDIDLKRILNDLD